MELATRALCLTGLTAEFAPAMSKVGCVTIRGWIAHKQRTGKELHVYVNGEDVTYRCCRADDQRGYAVCHKLGINGRPYCGPNGHVASEILRGDVRIVEQEA